MNLHQHDFALALTHIDQVLRDEPDKAAAYGSLALSLGALIHQNGLCQALAFLASKTESRAHQLALDHLAAILERPANGLLAHVGGLPAMDYLLSTERAQAAWVYHKRFAESVLGATKGEEVAP